MEFFLVLFIFSFVSGFFLPSPTQIFVNKITHFISGFLVGVLIDKWGILVNVAWLVMDDCLYIVLLNGSANVAS